MDSWSVDQRPWPRFAGGRGASLCRARLHRAASSPHAPGGSTARQWWRILAAQSQWVRLALRLGGQQRTHTPAQPSGPRPTDCTASPSSPPLLLLLLPPRRTAPSPSSPPRTLSHPGAEPRTVSQERAGFFLVATQRSHPRHAQTLGRSALAHRSTTHHAPRTPGAECSCLSLPLHACLCARAAVEPRPSPPPSAVVRFISLRHEFGPALHLFSGFARCCSVLVDVATCYRHLPASDLAFTPRLTQRAPQAIYSLRPRPGPRPICAPPSS
jgi:hypothetical protein